MHMSPYFLSWMASYPIVEVGVAMDNEVEVKKDILRSFKTKFGP